MPVILHPGSGAIVTTAECTEFDLLSPFDQLKSLEMKIFKRFKSITIVKMMLL